MSTQSLPTLIRLKQQALDEKRRILSALESESAAVDGRIRTLEQEAAAEAAAASGNAAASFGYGSYFAAVRVRRTGLEAERAALEQKIAEARDAVAEAFRDMKRFELAQAFAAQRAANEAIRREQANLDEIGLTGYRQAKARSFE